MRIPLRLGPLNDDEMDQAIAWYVATYGRRVRLRRRRGRRSGMWLAYGWHEIDPPRDPVEQLQQGLAAVDHVIGNLRKLGKDQD